MEKTVDTIASVKQRINIKELSVKLLFLLAAFTSVLVVILIYGYALDYHRHYP